MYDDSQKIKSLNFMRFVCFVLVFILHLGVYKLNLYNESNGAACAVSFFFIESGALSAYYSNKSDKTISVKKIFDYLKKKVCKYYPLYIITTLFAAIYYGPPLYFANNMMVELKESLIQLGKNALLIQSWFPSEYFSFNGVGWFLSTIFFCYVLNNFFKYMANKIYFDKNSIMYFIICIVLISTGIIVYCYATRNINVEFFQYVFPLSRVGEYVNGMCVGYIACLVKEKSNLQSHKLSLTILELLSLALFVFNILSNAYLWTFRIVKWLFTNMLLIFLLILNEGYISKLMSNKYFDILGDISYECFITHQVVISIYTIITNIPGVILSVKIFSSIFCFLLTIILSYQLHKSM